MDLIIYHANCLDGWTAAYVAKLRYPEAELMEYQYGVEPPYDAVVGKDVLVVDFSFKTVEAHQKLWLLAKSFRIIDHHKSQADILSGTIYSTFDVNRSGAGLTWDYLLGVNSSYDNCFQPRPWWVDYAEDHDLWRFKLPNSREINAYLKTVPRTVAAWDSVRKLNPEDVLNLGIGSLSFVDYTARSHAKMAAPGLLGALTVAVLNTPAMFISEAGALLSKDYHVVLGWYERSDNLIQFGLRSQEGSDIDVSQIAKGLGGGGHKHAAGFELPINKGREFIDKILGRSSYEPTSRCC